jgi:DNA replication protein DnaC
MSELQSVADSGFLKAFCDAMPDGNMKRGLIAATERRAKRIAEVGYEQYRAEYEAESARRLREAEIKSNAEYSMRILENSGLGRKFFSRTFNTFKVAPKNERVWEACCAIANGTRTKGVLIAGPNGVGKTHLAAAVVLALAKKGRRVTFRNMVDLVAEYKDGFKTGTEKVIARVLDGDLIVLDDMGAEYSKDDSSWVNEMLYKIVNRTYEDNKILIVTTNLSDLEFTYRYSSRTTSRIYEMTERIEYSDDDHRLFEPLDDDEPTPFDTN